MPIGKPVNKPVDESVIDNAIDNAAAYVKKANCNLWVAGMYAHRVVDQCGYYGALAISQKSGKSPDAILNWADGYALLSAMLTTRHISDSIRPVWRELTISHFYELAKKRRKYGLSIEACAVYLAYMLQEREAGNSWSVNTMRQQIEADYGQAGPTWEYTRTQLPKTILHWWADCPFDDELHNLLRPLANWAERNR